VRLGTAEQLQWPFLADTHVSLAKSVILLGPRILSLS
jgi:hypothetical protein